MKIDIRQKPHEMTHTFRNRVCACDSSWPKVANNESSIIKCCDFHR